LFIREILFNPRYPRSRFLSRPGESESDCRTERAVLDLPVVGVGRVVDVREPPRVTHVETQRIATSVELNPSASGQPDISALDIEQGTVAYLLAVLRAGCSDDLTSRGAPDLEAKLGPANRNGVT
jgi:hypothetical protein